MLTEAISSPVISDEAMKSDLSFAVQASTHTIRVKGKTLLANP